MLMIFTAIASPWPIWRLICSSSGQSRRLLYVRFGYPILVSKQGNFKRGKRTRACSIT